MATTRQVEFALKLLDERGYSTSFLGPAHERFGAIPEKDGSVRDWLKNMSTLEAADLIGVLLEEE